MASGLLTIDEVELQSSAFARYKSENAATSYIANCSGGFGDCQRQTSHQSISGPKSHAIEFGYG
jgi:hypothetical protein